MTYSIEGGLNRRTGFLDDGAALELNEGRKVIAGQSPRIDWALNLGGRKRTMEEVPEILREYGVFVPDDVDFFEDEEHELTEDITARGPKVTKLAGSIIHWSDLINTLTGKVPFLIRSDILKSDEAIAAVLGHEIHELEALRGLLKMGKTTIEHFINQTRPDNPGNLHEEAWDYADELVRQMRRKRQ